VGIVLLVKRAGTLKKEGFGVLHLVKKNHHKYANQQLRMLTIWHTRKEDGLP
jgi:hypothetical protein